MPKFLFFTVLIFLNCVSMKVKIQHSFTNIKVATFNCRGLNDHVKRTAVFEFFMNSDITIVCLQETKLNPDKEIMYTREWTKGPSFFNSIRGGKSGTAILFNTWQIDIKKFLCDEIGRVITLDVDVCGTMLHVMNTYFPNSPKEQYSFIKSLQPFFYSAFPIIWLGDHNISTDNKKDRLPRRTGMDKFGKNILEIIENFDLIDVVQTCYPFRNDLFTFTQGSSKSRIDKIIVQDSFVLKEVSFEPNLHSDHVVVVAQLQLDQKIEKGFGYWKNNTSVYENDVFVQEFKLLWESWVVNSKVSCPIEFWMGVKKKIKAFLMDIARLFAKERKDCRLSKYKNLMAIFQSSVDDFAMSDFLKEKKELAKQEIKHIKEKIDQRKGFLSF